jgi:hypothetical protein
VKVCYHVRLVSALLAAVEFTEKKKPGDSRITESSYRLSASFFTVGTGNK